MLLIRPPGVYPPQGDTERLISSLRHEPLGPTSRVLDVGTGTGAVALAAAGSGARVTAVDLSGRAVAAAWRAGLFERLGLIAPGDRAEGLAVVRGVRQR
ncbi:methyltransferase domain-containing protein [Kitasatospora sp. NPDC086009]|uniref:methyltransferase domain-containing protein n=1 Tax=unclassified Kitasatospora TaxID=2633591 RepID=UPI0037CC3CE9